MDAIRQFLFEQLEELASVRPDIIPTLRKVASEQLGRPEGIQSIQNVALSTNTDDVHNLLAQIKPDLKYLFVIDLDNTVWRQYDNLIVPHLQLHQAIDFPYRTFDELLDIEKSKSHKIKPVILTARTSTELQCVSDPLGSRPVLRKFDKYCTMGIVHCRDLWGTRYPEGLTYASAVGPSQVETWKQEARRVLTEMTRLDPSRQKMFFSGDPNGFYISYTSDSKQFKDHMTQFVTAKETDEFKWTLQDSKDGNLSIFINEKLPFTKAEGIEFLLKHQGVDLKDPNLRVVVFGDSSSDLKAMKRVKQLLPQHQVMNVRVGGAIDDACIDYSFRDITDTQRFISELHRQVG